MQPLSSSEVHRGGPAAGQTAQRGRVLVIDDDETLATLIKRALGGDHDVQTANGGIAALRILEADDGFDVILCDVMMRGMSGCDLYDRLLAERPGTVDRFVFISGGVFTERAQEFFRRVSNTRLEKPFAVKDLRRLVRAKVDAIAH